jgi:ABC-type antimicrobial peptide transport system permease subunit
VSYKQYLILAIPFVFAFILITLFGPADLKLWAIILFIIPGVIRDVVNFVHKRKERKKQ